DRHLAVGRRWEDNFSNGPFPQAANAHVRAFFESADVLKLRLQTIVGLKFRFCAPHQEHKQRKNREADQNEGSQSYALFHDFWSCKNCFPIGCWLFSRSANVPCSTPLPPSKTTSRSEIRFALGMSCVTMIDVMFRFFFRSITN